MSARKRLRMWGFSAVAGLLAALMGVWIMLGTDPAAASRVDPAAIDISALDRVPKPVWEKLRQKRVFFGHQSVGADIVAGLEAIARKKPELGLRIVESREPGALDQPGFVHSKVGTNESCESKLTDFAALMRGPLGQRVDIAFMKFCYVDLTSAGDPAALFASYQKAMADLSAACPRIAFVHTTIPMTTIEAGPKARVKRMLGRTHLGGYHHNLVRQRFNNAVQGHYGKAVFDLARSEATLPDGRVAGFNCEGLACLCLSSGYTSDGGHLNDAGRLAVARDLLLFLAEQCK